MYRDNDKKISIRKTIFIMLVGTIMLSIIIPIILVCFYVVPAADDISNTVPYINNSKMILLYCLRRMMDYYKTWQGTYLGTFLVAYPVYYIHGIIGLRMVMFFVALFFLLSLLFLVYTIINRFVDKSNRLTTCLCILTIILFYITCTNQLNEIFFWYTGACVYTIPLSLFFICIACQIRMTDYHSKVFLYVGILSTFLASGGALNIGTMLCGVTFFVFLIQYITIRYWKGLSIFCIALIGTMINLLAPGNYIRHNKIDSEIHIFKELIFVIKRVVMVLLFDTRNGILLLVFFAAFIIFYKHHKYNIDNIYLDLSIIIYFGLLIFVVDLPVAVGLSSSRSIPERCQFVEHIAIIVFVLVCAYCISDLCIMKHFSFSNESLALIGLVTLICFSHYGISNLIPYRMLWHYYKNDYNVAQERELSIIEQIEESQSQDVICYYEKPSDDEWTNICVLGANEDPDDWINDALRTIYNKKSVIVYSREKIYE